MVTQCIFFFYHIMRKNNYHKSYVTVWLVTFALNANGHEKDFVQSGKLQ